MRVNKVLDYIFHIAISLVVCNSKENIQFHFSVGWCAAFIWSNLLNTLQLNMPLEKEEISIESVKKG